MRGVVPLVALAFAVVAACADEDLARPRIGATAISLPGLSASGPAATRVALTPSAGHALDQLPLFYRYEAKAGDTVESIARMFNLTPESVAWNNEAALAAGALRAGTLLEIPSGDGILHRIQLGETLSEIATRYGVELQAIFEFPANDLASPRPLEGGVILVPGGRRR